MKALAKLIAALFLVLCSFVPQALAQTAQPATDTTDADFWEKRNFYSFPFYMRLGDSERGTETKMYSPFYWQTESQRSTSSFSLLHYKKDNRETGSSTFVLPGYYSRNSKSEVMEIAPFYYLRKTEERHTRIISPFFIETATKRGGKTAVYAGLYWAREDKRLKTALSPFHYSTEDKVKGTRSSHLLYFYWEQETKKSEGSGILPLYWHARGKGDASDEHTVVYPPVLYYDKQTTRGATTIYGPAYITTEDKGKGESFSTVPLLLYWQKKTRKGESWGFFPVFWSSSGETESTTILPLLIHHEESARRKMLLLGPLYADVEYPEQDSGFGTIAGLLWWKKDRDQISRFSPIFYYRSTEGTNDYSLLTPFGYRSVEGEYSTTALPGFYHSRDEEGETTLAPGYYHSRDAESETTVAPLYYHNRNLRGEREFLIFRYRDRYGARTRELYPGLFTTEDSESKTYLAPLVYYRSKKDSDDYSLFAGLYYRKIEGEQQTRAFPGYYHTQDNEGETTAFPGYYYNRNGEDETQLFPGYYYHKDKRGESEWLLLRYRDRIGDRTRVLYPGLFTSENSEAKTYLAPLVYYRSKKDSDDYSLFAGLYYRKIEGEQQTRAFPGYYHTQDNEGETTAFPGYYYNRDDEDETQLFPGYFYHKDKLGESEWLLLRYRDRVGDRTRELWPGYVNINDRKGETTLSLFYYDYSSNENPTDFSTCIGPYFKSVWGDETTEIFAPFYFSGSKADKGWNLVPPVWIRSYDRNQTTDVFPGYVRSRGRNYNLDLAPFVYWKRTSDNSRGKLLIGPYFNIYNERSDYKSLFPLFYQKKGKDYLNRLMLPLFYDQQEKDSRFIWHLPLGFYWSDKTSYEYNFAYLYTQERGEDYFGWRFLNSFYYREPDHTEITSVLYPLTYFRSNDATDTYYQSVAWPLFMREKDEEKNETLNILFWLFHQEQNSELKQYYLSLIWPLFVHESNGEDFSTYFLWRLYSNQKLGDDRNLSLLFLYDRNENSESIRHTVFPLAEYQIDKASGRGSLGCLFPYNYLPPFHFYWEREDGSYLREIMLLAVMAEDRETSSFHLYPNIVFYNRNKVVGTQSLDILWPLFNHTWDDYSSSTRVLPFYYGATDPESSSTVIPFPPILWFNFENREGHSRFQIPFYWDFAGPDYLNRVVFPFYWNFRNAESETTYLLPWYSYRDARIEKQRFYPIYYFDQTENVTELDILPVYSKKTDRLLDEEYLLTLLWYHKRKGTKHTYGIPPLPVLWSEDTQTGDTTKRVFPLYWAGDNTREKYYSFFPLFYYNREKLRERVNIYSLLFFYNRDAQKTTYTVPLALSWYSAHKNDHDWELRAPFPLIWAGRERGNGYAGVLPLFWYNRNDHDDSSWLWALNYYHENDRDSFLQYFVPLWRYESNRDDMQFSWLLPPMNFSRFREYENYTILPLFWYQKEMPQSGEESSKLWVFPTIWWRESGNESVSAFYPLYYQKQNELDYTLQVGPIYYESDRTGTAAHLAPVYFSGSDNDGNSWRVIPPLLHYSRYLKKGEKYKNDFVLGPVWSLEDAKDYTFWIFPLFRYYASQKPDRNHWQFFLPGLWIERDEDKFTMLSPLYIENSDRHQVERAMLIPPLYQKYNPDDMWGDGTHCLVCWPSVYSSRDDFYTVFPFYWQFGSEDKRTHLTLPPVYVSSVTPNSRKSLYGMVWYESEDREGDFRTVLGWWYDGTDKVEDSEYQVLFPFYWYFRDKEDEKTIALVYNKFKSGTKTTTTYLNVVITSDTETETEGWGVMPFFYSEESPDSSYFSLLLDLFGYEKKKGRKRIFIFGFPVEL
jgi:hypothetical protein